MFTGLIREIGILRATTARGGVVRLDITAPVTAEDLGVGDSVAVNGICLTAIAVGDRGFSAEAATETRRLTTLDSWRTGRRLHLERALRVGDPLDGQEGQTLRAELEQLALERMVGLQHAIEPQVQLWKHGPVVLTDDGLHHDAAVVVEHVEHERKTELLMDEEGETRHDHLLLPLVSHGDRTPREVHLTVAGSELLLEVARSGDPHPGGAHRLPEGGVGEDGQCPGPRPPQLDPLLRFPAEELPDRHKIFGHLRLLSLAHGWFMIGVTKLRRASRPVKAAKLDVASFRNWSRCGIGSFALQRRGTRAVGCVPSSRSNPKI